MSAEVWLSSSLRRWFPRSQPGTLRLLRLVAARGEQVSFQVCVQTPGAVEPVPVTAQVSDSNLDCRLRRVGCVPVPHHNTHTPDGELDGLGHIPGYVPDPLYEELSTSLAPRETQSYWVTVRVPPDAASGPHEVVVSVRAGDSLRRLKAVIHVASVTLQPRQAFPVTHWFYADALCDWYGLVPWSEHFWPVFRRYLANYVDRGFDTLLTPLFTPPLDGVKRPTQLLRVTRDRQGYRFDWTDVDRWIRIARDCGIHYFEWPHWFTQWGARHAIRIYEGQGLDEKPLWAPSTGATSRPYRDFLSRLLPELRAFLTRRRLLESSFFHVSDEPHGAEHRANYVAARALLRELAPWMRVMDALSEIEYGREGLTDTPIPSIGVARRYAEEGIPSWTYFCCGPRGAYLNRLLDTPLAKIRAAGWLFHRFRRQGFLHWGYNYWYKSQTRQLIDPFTVTDGQAWPDWAYGDPFIVYPGPEGPLDSLRGEVFRESLQDLALLQTLGVEPEGKLLQPFRDFDDFPKTEAWFLRARARLLGPSPRD